MGALLRWGCGKRSPLLGDEFVTTKTIAEHGSGHFIIIHSFPVDCKPLTRPGIICMTLPLEDTTVWELRP